MCGFIGYIPGENPVDHEHVMKEMLTTIIHRGPDNQDVYLDDQVKLGFARLSILDLSNAANQPFVDENVVMVFNGEIYNYREIRRELVEHGYEFTTSSDSEVLLKGYLHYGEAIIEKLRGMFAFLIWDKPKDKFIMARDPFGIKPFYYTQTADGTIIFGSEIKSFLKHPSFEKKINKKALKPYLTFQYSVLDETFFQGVFRVEPGTYMTINGNKQMEVIPYFDKSFKEQKKGLADYIQDIKETVEDSVQVHRASDVKVGSFLSGGIDSSYITSLLRPQKTFTIGFEDYEEMFDETLLASDLAGQLDIELHKKYVTAEESFEAFPTIQWHMDEPHSDPSIIPLYFLNEMASKEVTVILSGEGADEFFGGYEWYQPSPKMDKYKKLPLVVRQTLSSAAKYLPENQYTKFAIKAMLPIEERFIGHALVWSEADAIAVLKKEYHESPSIQEIVDPYYAKMNYQNDTDKMQHLDFDLWLSRAILLKADKMSMAHSIELRVPFLDSKVFDSARQLPTDYRVGYGKTKIALREAALDNLPEDWANRKKLGFPVPIRHWMKEDKFYNQIRSTFQQKYVEEFFNQAVLLEYLEEHYQGKGNYARYIWTVYTFCVWYEQFFPEECR